MKQLRVFLAGPWRAVAVLGVTQILAWGTLFYTPVLMLPRLAADRGFTATLAMAGFSAGLLVAGFVARYVGILIDLYGGHRVMPVGSLLGALGLLGLAYAADPLSYFAVWVVLGAAMAASLYDPAFATLGRIFGARARQPITALTLAGGFASTVSWPATQALLDALGWRGTYLFYAALLAGIAAPLHWLALPRRRAEPETRLVGPAEPAPALFPARSRAFVLVAAAFAAYAFVPSGLSAHLLAVFSRHGIDPGTVVVIGALFGPAQVTARICEFAFARNVHPLWVVRFALSVLVVAFALLALFGFSIPAAAAFAILFGASNGLMTIARGTVPLALFGAVGYGRLIGRIAGPSLLMQGVAPLVLAFVIEHGSDPLALLLAAGLTLIALICFIVLRRPEIRNQ
ncbi:MAG TPA: MFS transporter [Xanthobacteraceae bacterium]